MHIAWDSVQLVLAIADAGSLSGAARALRTTQPTISRRLAELEASLGEPVFRRAVDGTTPTSFGERLLEPARKMAEAAAEVSSAAGSVDRSPRGVVRISAAPGIAATLLAPFASLLRTEAPAIQLEIVSTTRYVDLVRREADLAVRLASTSRADRQRDLVAVTTVEHPVVAFATPGYLATRKRGYGLADLDWIGWCPPLEHLPPNPQLAARIPAFRPVFGADDFLIQLRAAESGVGAIVLSGMRYRLEPPSPLVPVAIDLGVPAARTQLVGARGALAVPRVAAVAALLARELSTTQRPARSRTRS